MAAFARLTPDTRTPSAVWLTRITAEAYGGDESAYGITAHLQVLDQNGQTFATLDVDARQYLNEGQINQLQNVLKALRQKAIDEVLGG